MKGYLNNGNKTECFGCEACVQVCPKQALAMVEDHEGFRYPHLSASLCIHCNACHTACPKEHMPEAYLEDKYAFGGYHVDQKVRFSSTSGGAFSAVVDAFCDENYVIFGAEAKGLKVFHSYITDKKDLEKFRKSKYSQSAIGNSYKEVRKFLAEGKKVLFSGTPCQIAALKTSVKNMDQTNLLTVEVVCEGVPSPHYVRKLDEHLKQKHGAGIEEIDYRYTDHSWFRFSNDGNEKVSPIPAGKWDFQVMRIKLAGKKKALKKDRWGNPFWSIWLNHLMSRPSCYECPFAHAARSADITLGDLWGVHLYCPELYGNNSGASLIVANTPKGKKITKKAEEYMAGHELQFEQAQKYQAPMRKHINGNPDREAFMADLESDMPYSKLTRKWAKNPSPKLLWQKYIWGNRQVIAMWNLKNRSEK